MKMSGRVRRRSGRDRVLPRLLHQMAAGPVYPDLQRYSEKTGPSQELAGGDRTSPSPPRDVTVLGSGTTPSYLTAHQRGIAFPKERSSQISLLKTFHIKKVRPSRSTLKDGYLVKGNKQHLDLGLFSNFTEIPPKELHLSKNDKDFDEQSPFNVYEIEEHEEEKNGKTNYKEETSVYKDGHLMKTRTDFKNDALVIGEGREKACEQFVRTNAATLLKEAAMILKEEEMESKKILDLLVGSPNFREYEQMLEDRIEEEREMFRLKIERLHLEGRLTDQAAVIARLRLGRESKERRKQFEKEREMLLEDMNQLKEKEKHKISNLVARVRKIHDRVATQKQNMQQKKKLEVEKLSKEIQQSLRETMTKERQNLEKRVMVIKEVRAYQAFKKSLKQSSVRKKVISVQPKSGLLCEMSLEELEMRKNIVKEKIQNERAERRESILRGIREKESLLDRAEDLIRKSRERRRLARRGRGVRGEREVEQESIPEVLLRPLVRGAADEGERLAVMEQNAKTLRELPRRAELCREERARQAATLQAALDRKAAVKAISYRDRPDGFRGMRRNVKSINELAYQSGNNYLQIVRKISEIQLGNRKNNSSHERHDSEGYSLLNKEQIIWAKFKTFISKNTNLKMPKYLEELVIPPKLWTNMKRKKSILKRFRKGKSKSTLKLKLSTKKGLRKRKLKAVRVFKIRTKKREKKEMKKKKYWKWMKRWQAFYKTFMDAEVRVLKFQTLEKLDDEYTKKIISRINYYNNVLKKTAIGLNEEKVKSKLWQDKEEIIKLKAKLEFANEMIKKNKKMEKMFQRKTFPEPEKLKPLKETKKRFMLPIVNSKMASTMNIKNYFEDVVKISIFEDEDNEILERPLKPPFRDLTMTNAWVYQGEHTSSLFKGIEKKVKSLPENYNSEICQESPIHLWELPKFIRRGNKYSPSSKPQVAVKRLASYSDKYSHYKNKFGNPIFTLKPTIRNKHSLEWTWAPVLVERHDGVREKKGRGGLLGKLMELRLDELSLVSLHRTQALRALLSYARTHPLGGDPPSRPAQIIV